MVALGREFGVSIAQRAKKDDQIRSLVDSGELQIPGLFRVLGRDAMKRCASAFFGSATARSRTTG